MAGKSAVMAGFRPRPALCGSGPLQCPRRAQAVKDSRGKGRRTENIRAYILSIRKQPRYSRLLPLLVFLAPLIVYSVTLTAGFVYDDNVQVLTNPWIRDPGRIPELFVSSTMSFLRGQTANTYRPVFYIIYMAEYRLFGLSPWGWHLVNLLLHSLNALVVYRLAALLIRDGAGLAGEDSVRSGSMAGPLTAGLFFGLHPVNSEVVSWVGTIPELFFTLMVLTALILYIRAEGAGGRRPLYLGLSAACFAVGLYSKETAMSLIILIPLYELIRRGLWGCVRRWRVFILYLVPAVVYMVMRTYALGGMTQMSLIKMTPYEGLLNVPALVARYLGKLILPMGLTIIYDFEPVRSAAEPLFIIGLIACCAFAALVYYARKNRREVFFLLWILVPILPVLYMPILSVGGFADRYLYLSTAGFACLAGLVTARAEAGQQGRLLTPRALRAAAAVILAVYAAAAFSRGLVWRNDLTLWSDTVKKSPASPNALYNLAWTLHKRDKPGDKDRALALYEEALRIKPDKEDAHYNAALIYQERRQYRKALEHFLASLRLRPDYSTTYYNIAAILQAMGRTKRAIEFYEGALRIDPAYEDAHYNLAWAYQDMGRYDKALVHYREVLKINPGSVDALYNMGVIYEEQGRPADALAKYKRALAIDPSYGPARVRAARLGSKAD